MSISVPLTQLTQPQRVAIMKELRFQNKTTQKWVEAFDLDESETDADCIRLPFAFARSMGFSTRERDAFPAGTQVFGGTLRPYQQDVKVQTIKQLNRAGSCMLSLHVGWGKSVFATYLACKLKLKTLIVVNRIVLINQWKELIEELCPASRVQTLSAKTKELDPTCDFFMVNALNIAKMPPGFFSAIGTLISDEVHMLCASSLFKAFFHLAPKYAIALSATPTRPDGLDKLITLYFGEDRIAKDLFRKHTVYAVETGITLAYDLNWEGRMDWNSLLNNQAVHAARHALILRILREYKDRNFLVLCKRVAQAERIVASLQEAGESVTDLLGSKAEFDKEARILVAVAQKCGFGFSHNRLDALLMAADVEEYFIQYLGRVFRTPHVEPIVFDILDSNPVLHRHFATRKRVYKKTGGVVRTVSEKTLFGEQKVVKLI